MGKIDELHTEHPTWGYRTLTKIIRRDHGILVNREKNRRAMRLMGVYTIFPKPNLSKRYHAQHVRPYLLRKLAIERPNQVWGVDIRYIRMHRGFMYLFIIIDWYSRKIVDYELSGTLEKSFVLRCLKRALNVIKPDVINSDQGSHFTIPDYINLLEESDVKISMDGKGQALDNVRTERFFRTLKYDLIYIHEFETPRARRTAIGKYMHECNPYRPYSSVGVLTLGRIILCFTRTKIKSSLIRTELLMRFDGNICWGASIYKVGFDFDKSFQRIKPSPNLTNSILRISAGRIAEKNSEEQTMNLNKIILGMALITLVASTSVFAFASSDPVTKLANAMGAPTITKTVLQRVAMPAAPLTDLGKTGYTGLPLETVTALPLAKDEGILVKKVEGGIEIVRAQVGTLNSSDFGAVMETVMPTTQMKAMPATKGGNK